MLLDTCVANLHVMLTDINNYRVMFIHTVFRKNRQGHDLTHLVRSEVLYLGSRSLITIVACAAHFEQQPKASGSASRGLDTTLAVTFVRNPG